MKRNHWMVSVLLAATFACGIATAEPLEVGLVAVPTVLQDHAYEAFSSDLAAARVGLDLRSEVLSWRGFGLALGLGYRFARDGSQIYDDLHSSLDTHELQAAARLRMLLTNWLFVFAEAQGGLLWGLLEARSANDDGGGSYGLGGCDRYADKDRAWSFGGLAGVELKLSKKWLASRGVKKIGFSGELAGGYIRRGDMRFAPELVSRSGNDLPVATSPSWGDVNLSGWEIQLGAALRFF